MHSVYDEWTIQIHHEFLIYACYTLCPSNTSMETSKCTIVVSVHIETLAMGVSVRDRCKLDDVSDRGLAR